MITREHHGPVSGEGLHIKCSSGSCPRAPGSARGTQHCQGTSGCPAGSGKTCWCSNTVMLKEMQNASYVLLEDLLGCSLQYFLLCIIWPKCFWSSPNACHGTGFVKVSTSLNQSITLSSHKSGGLSLVPSPKRLHQVEFYSRAEEQINNFLQIGEVKDTNSMGMASLFGKSFNNTTSQPLKIPQCWN